MKDRTISITHPVESVLFGPYQFHAHSLMQMSYSSMWSWGQHCLHVSFPSMIKDYAQAVVAVGAEVEYLEPFEVFDADEFSITVERFHVRQANSVFDMLHTITAAGINIARVSVRWKLVVLDGDDALSATSGVVREALLQQFLPSEINPSRVKRPLPEKLEIIELQGVILTSFEHPFTLYRHRCEVADQWAFNELPALGAESRESLIDALENDPHELCSSLGYPLKTITMEWRCPFYLLDKGVVTTTAYKHIDALVFVHKIYNITRANTLAAIVIEEF